MGKVSGVFISIPMDPAVPSKGVFGFIGCINMYIITQYLRICFNDVLL